MAAFLKNLLVLAAFPFASSALGAGAVAPRKLDFNRDIRPILSDNCFACHGFDAKKRKADLRLDVAEGAFAKSKEGTVAIKPGDVAGSELIKRIVTKDEDDLMPPADSHKKLTSAQIETLKRWVAEGAPYKKHWSFEAPVKPAVPADAGGGGQGAGAGASGTVSQAPSSVPLTPIDAFISSELAAHKLAPAPAATLEQIIRRVTLDLTGLPPTPAEVDAFVSDSSDQSDRSDRAYERLIDRLMQSPRYGEHMARYWLDAARYGDTHGLHLDNERGIWPYRDWVVRAFNNNLPFDQFTVWQLAGDLLPNATQDQMLASAFNRCNVTTGEGGSINEEWIYRYAVDRTDAVISVWMGLTGGCAVCHDHKYDPITMKDFYSLYAFFNSAADPAMDGNILLTAPSLRLSTPDQAKQLADLDKQIAAKQAEIRKAIATLNYVDPATQNPAPPVQTSEVVWFDDAFPPKANVESSGGHATTFVTKEQGPVASGTRALKRTATSVSQDFFSTGGNFTIPPNGKLSVQCYIDPANKPKSVMLQFFVGGWNHRAVWGEEGAIPFGKVRTTERVMIGALPEAGQWARLEFAADRLGLKPGMKVTGFAFTQFGGTVYWDRLAMSSRVDPAKDPQWSWSKWIEKNQGKRVEGLPNDLLTLVRGKKSNEWPAADAKRVQDWWFENEYQGARGVVESAKAEKLAIESKKTTLESTIPASLVMADLPEPREAFVMQRGQYDKPGEKVTRRTPVVFPPLPKKDNYNRLDLAQWLVSPQHPLTARVTVNRLWQQFFGTGIVKTANDFGSQGTPPTHPELLDWLAIDFREHGWDVKRFVKQIVMSQTYRQSSKTTPDLLAADPENKWLARGPRHRLDAEVLRDKALFVSGLLNQTVGGKGVRPYQPDNIWEPVAYSGSNTRSYVRDTGAALYRRSLYTFYKRTAPAPSMTTFDAPSREQVCLRRERSNTPLQALALMNDIQHMEAARNFAQRILLEGGDTFDKRLTFAFRSVVSRFPRAEEVAIVNDTLQKHLARYQATPDAAKQLITFGDSKPDPKLKPEELAAWTMIGNLLLNLDEALNQ
ncbi:MAG: PSD1 and planctomycete cytochrome C domain-containing protein [Verrucomicrobiaceae bacterium]|nr:PSD1 and planctomycete cytochrome C domain-containing protein [Verrucomicrobiaceae bacterium]